MSAPLDWPDQLRNVAQYPGTPLDQANQIARIYRLVPELERDLFVQQLAFELTAARAAFAARRRQWT